MDSAMTLRSNLVLALTGAAAMSLGCSDQVDPTELAALAGGAVDEIQSAATLACQQGPENTNAACSDGISNDGDAYIDCDDFNCCGAGLNVCSCCGTGCGPVYPDICSCPIACSTNSQCGPGQYCWAAGDCNAACRPIPASPPAAPMKVVEYNVLGTDPKDPNPGWVNTLAAQDADVAILVETDWDDIKTGTTTWCTYYFNLINSAMTSAGRQPYTDYHCARGITFFTLGTSILSRYPILSATHVGEGHPVMGYQDDGGSVSACDTATTDPFMDWKLQAPGGTPVHAISAHLKCCNTAGDEQARREKSQECINNSMDSLGSATPLIYSGDLNSFSPTDGDPSCFGQSGLGVGPLQILYSSTDSRRTLNHTWTDAYRHWTPLQCGNASSYGITYPSFSSRIDFIEVNQQLQSALGAAAVGSGAGSDHLPLSVVLNLGGSGCTSNPACDDGLFCNGAETCVNGTCQGGTPPSCADSVTCTVDSCNEATDSCDHTANNAACDDGRWCNGAETCSITVGCQAGTPPITCAPPTVCSESSHQCVSCVPSGQGLPCTATTNCCTGVGNCTGGKPAQRVCR
jgi:hypothetical protein